MGAGDDATDRMENGPGTINGGYDLGRLIYNTCLHDEKPPYTRKKRI